MVDKQNCDDCIYHDGFCINRDCLYISREEAKEAVLKQRAKEEKQEQKKC